MTSTNDGNEVNSNQKSGHRIKSYYIELYKSLEARLNGEGSLEARTTHVCEAWRRVYSLYQHSAPSTHPHLFSWLQRHTASTVLQSKWAESKNEHARLTAAIDSLVAEVQEAAAGRDLQPYEQLLLQRASWFRKAIENPWGHPVLKSLINPNSEPVTDQQVLEWLVEERGIVLVTRLRQLVTAGNCYDLALLLASAVMDRARAATPRQPDDASDDKVEEPQDKTSFVAVLERDAGFTTDVWELLTDIELVLLLKTDKRPQCIDLAKQTPLRQGYAMIERLRLRLETSPRDKKLWKHAKEVATLVTQVIIARCMVLQKCAGAGRTALYFCARALARLVPPARLPAVSNTLAAAAVTARHLHTFCTALDAQCSADMKPFICELYVRAITAGMNELEQLKLKAEKTLETRSCEQMLASWFSQLGGLLDGSPRLRAECELTAFSVHPAPNFYERVADMPQPPPLKTAQEPAPETTSEFGSWANDSRTQSSLVKTSETLQMKQTEQHQANVLSTAVLTEGETLGLEPELCQDLAVLLSGPRVKTLSWDMDREALLQNCRSYMERTDGGTRAVTTELKYLNLDPSAYRHLPEEDDEETGIERGYEHELQMEAPEEAYIWQDAFFDDELTESALDSEVEIQFSKLTKAGKKKSKASVVSSDDEDPLSCLADAKKEKKKLAKEKSKEQRRKKTNTTKDASNTTRDTSKDGNRDRRKDKGKKIKKESKNKSEQPMTGSLTSLLGMKVTNAPSPVQDGEKRVRKKKERRRNTVALFNYVSVTDNNSDNQEKSSQTSDNDPNVVVEGVFSMDEIKSPERQSDSQTDNMKPTLKTYGIAQSTVINDIKSRPKLSSKLSSTSDDSDVSRSKSPYLTPNHLGNRHVVCSKVKSSISKLLQFRRNKSLLRPVSKSPAPSTQPVTAQTLVGMKIYKPDEITKVNTNKKPQEAISKDMYSSNLVSESSKMVSVNNRPQVPYTDTAKADKLQNLYNVQRHSQAMQGMSQNMLNESQKVHTEYIQTSPSKLTLHSNYITYQSPSNVYSSHVSPGKTVDHINPVLNLSPPKVTLAHPFHKSLQNLSFDNMKHDAPKRPVLINDPNYLKHQQAKSNSQLSPRIIQNTCIKAPSQTASSGRYAKDDFTLSHNNLMSRGSAQNLNSQVTNLKSNIRYGSKQHSSSMQDVNVLGSVGDDVTKTEVPSPDDMRLGPTSCPLTYSMKSHSNLSNTSQNVHISNNTSVSRCIPIQHRNRDVKTQQNVLPTQNNPESGLKANYQEFFDNLARSINAGSSEPGKTHSIALNKDVKVTPVQVPSTSVTAKRIDSTQCAKQLIQQKKTENAPNTFSRRSYMHKNKQNESKLLSDNLSLELNKNILDHKLIRAQCMKNDVIISRVNPNKQEQGNIVSKIHQSSTKLQKTCPLLTSMLDSPGKSSGDGPTAGNATTISQNVSENQTDREGADLLLLLRQQPVVKPNLNTIVTLASDVASSQNLSSTPTKVLTPRVAINKTLIGAKLKHIGTILGNAPVNKESTPQDNAPQDWERVMEALLAHKTERLGPNALDMVLKKDYKRHSQSSSRPHVSHKPRNCNPSSSQSRPDSKKREHQSNQPSTATRKPSTQKHSEVPKRHRPSAENIKKVSSTEMLKKVDAQNKYVSSNSSKGGDPFISGIPNSAYDMLGDLMDDDVRQELGELFSDEDAYNTPNVAMAKEKSSNIPKTDTSECKISNIAKDIPRIVDPQIIVHRIESNTVVSSSTTCSTTGYPNVITNNSSHQDARTLPENRPTVVCSNIEQRHTATIITNQIVQPANMANHTIVGANHFISNIDPTNVIIASVPVQQPVVVIRQDLVYDPYPTIRIHESQVNAGLCSVNQNVYAINTTPNIAVYQTTQFAAPVVNPVIIGNAMTTTNVPADPVAMGDQQCTPDPINDSVKPQDQSNIDSAIASRLTEDNNELPGKSTNLDFNMNKNSERKVLSQVQEKHLTEKLDIDSHIRRLSVDDYSLTTEQHAERIKLKRQSLLNRKINHACYHPPIPLTYTPLSKKGNLGKLLQQETPKNGTIKLNLMSIENGTIDIEKRVSTDSTRVESSNSEVNNENIESNKQVSNTRENKESCRRIWLRSSNKLDDKVSPVKRTGIPPHRNKFKLKVTKKGIEKITDGQNENEEKVKNVPRISRRSVNENKKNIKKNELISYEKGTPPNQNQLQQKVLENGELIDFEEGLSGSKILRSSTELVETKEMSKAMDSNIITNNEGNYTTNDERIEDESCDSIGEMQKNLHAVKETEVTSKSNKPTNNDLKPTVVIERIQHKVGNQLVIKSLAAKAVQLPNDTNVINVKDKSPIIIPDKVEEEQADVSRIEPKDSKDATEYKKVTPELELQDTSQTSTINTESLNTNKTCATETSYKVSPKAANVKVQRKSNRLIKSISSEVNSQSNAKELDKTDSIISKTVDTNHTAMIQTDCPTTIVIDQPQTKILPETKNTHLSDKDIANTNSLDLTTNNIPQMRTNTNKSLLSNEIISDVLNKDSASNTNAIIEKRDLRQPINCQPTNLCQQTSTRTLTDKSKNNDNSAVTQANANWVRVKNNEKRKIYMNGDIKIEELPINATGVRQVRISLPNGKVFKATITGKIHGDCNFLFAQPAMRNLLAGQLSDGNKYTLNYTHVLKPNKEDPNKINRDFTINTQPCKMKQIKNVTTVETVSLISDDEDEVEAVAETRIFTTEFGKYTAEVDQETFNKHQIFFSQKCKVKLVRHLVIDATKPKVKSSPAVKNSLLTRKQSKVLSDSTISTNIIAEVDSSVKDDGEVVTPVSINSTDKRTAAQETSTSTFKTMPPDLELNQIKLLPDATCSTNVTPEVNSNSEEGSPSGNKSTPAEETTNLGKLPNEVSTNTPTLSQETPTPLRSLSSVNATLSIRDQSRQTANTDTIPGADSFTQDDDIDLPPVYLGNTVKSTLTQGASTLLRSVLPANNSLLTKNQSNLDADATTTSTLIPKINSDTKDDDDVLSSVYVKTTHELTSTPSQEQINSTTEVVKTTEIIEIDDSSNDSVESLTSNTDSSRNADPVADIIALKTTRLLRQNIGVKPTSEADMSIVKPHQPLSLVTDNLKTALLQDLGIYPSEAPIIDITSDEDIEILNVNRNIKECVIKIMRCDNLVKKYELMKAMKRCYVKLERLNNSMLKMATVVSSDDDTNNKTDERKQDYDEDYIVFEVEETLGSPQLSRCPSLSILNNWDEEDQTSPKSTYRSSPVMEVYDAIVQLCNELTDNTELVNETENSWSLTCDSEWTVTKFGYRTQELLLSSLTPTTENKDSEITLTGCDNITVSDEEKLLTTSKTPKLLTIAMKFLEENLDLVYRMESMRKTRNVTVSDEEKLLTTSKTPKLLTIAMKFLEENLDLVYRMESMRKTRNVTVSDEEKLLTTSKTPKLFTIAMKFLEENLDLVYRMESMRKTRNVPVSDEEKLLTTSKTPKLLTIAMKFLDENLDLVYRMESMRKTRNVTISEEEKLLTTSKTPKLLTIAMKFLENNLDLVYRMESMRKSRNVLITTPTNKLKRKIDKSFEDTVANKVLKLGNLTLNVLNSCLKTVDVNSIHCNEDVENMNRKKRKIVILESASNAINSFEQIKVSNEHVDNLLHASGNLDLSTHFSSEMTAIVQETENLKQVTHLDSLPQNENNVLKTNEIDLEVNELISQTLAIVTDDQNTETHSSARDCGMTLIVEKNFNSQKVNEIDIYNIENKKSETIEVDQNGHEYYNISTLVTEEDYCSNDATATVANIEHATQNVDSVMLSDIESNIPDENIMGQKKYIANTHSSAEEYDMTITVQVKPIIDELLPLLAHNETEENKVDLIEVRCQNDDDTLRKGKHKETNIFEDTNIATIKTGPEGTKIAVKPKQDDLGYNTENILPEFNDNKENHSEGIHTASSSSSLSTSMNFSVGSEQVITHSSNDITITTDAPLDEIPVDDLYNDGYEVEIVGSHGEDNVDIVGSLYVWSPESAPEAIPVNDSPLKSPVFIDSQEILFNYHDYTKRKENIINHSRECVTNQHNSDQLNEEGSGVKTAGLSLEVALKEEPDSEDASSNRNIEHNIKENYHPTYKPECKYELIQEDDWLTVITTENEKEEPEVSLSPNYALEDTVVASVCSKNASINIKGFEYDDVYVFPLSERSNSNISNDSIGQELNSDATVVSDIVKDDLHDINFGVIKPLYTYTRISLKRRRSMTDVKVPEKKYRKGKNIDCVKQTVTGMIESAYSREYKRLLEYCSSVKFSYLRPFHKECVEAEDLIEKWPIIGACPDVPTDVAEELLFANLEEADRFQPDPTTQTLAEEISYKYKETDAALENPSSEAYDSNFNMGFGEGSGRVIQNLKKGGESNISAATLSDVKQSQPVFKSVDIDDYKNTDSIKDDLVIKLRKHLNFIELRDRVRSFFEKSSIELKTDWIQHNIKDNADLNWRYDDKFHAGKFPFDLCSSEYMKPITTETVVQVVQVGQLPVSAAAQNPVTCDPRVTQVSDASPSQCSVDNSPNDDSQSDIKTEYTELTTADLTLPLQEYAQQNQAMNLASHENNMELIEQTISLEMEIKEEESPEIKEEVPDINEEKSNSSDTELYTLSNATPENKEYLFKNNEDKSDVNSVIYEAPEQNDSETFSQQRQQNGTSEKTDQIAHAMNAAGITTTPETVTNTRAHALVNILSQKIRHGVNTTQTTTNTYSKTTSINAMALQQALAQILPPPLNQTGSSENNQSQSTPVGPQVLHIVQGKNASGNQITLVDNSQQSVISTPNATQVLHIVQNKGTSAGQASNGTLTPQTNSFSGLSLVDAGLQQGGNQLLHIVNTGNQKTGSPGQLLKRVNLLTNLTNVQGSNEQKMVQFVCKSADGKAIQLNAPHQRSMVLRLQPIETPAAKPAESQEPSQSPTGSTSNKESASAQEIKSRSIYEENYAKFIQNSSSKTLGLEKSTSLPKFNQAFGKPVFQEGSQKQGDTANNNSHLPAVNTNTENAEGQANENAINLEHIVPIGSPPLLIRKQTPTTSQSQSNIMQQIKQTIAPMNIQTMHGGVIYTRQIPVNIGGGQTINLITVPSTELINDETAKTQTSQGEIEPSIIKIVPQGQSTTNSETLQEDSNNHAGSNESAPTPQPQPVLTQMRIKLPMLSKTPQMVQGARVVRPSFFQIQRNVIGGANQPVYQQLVLTAAPPLGQQTIRLPQAQASRPVKVPSESQSSSSESQMSSSTLEQLREFDMVLEQVKERSTVQPTGNSNNNSFKIHTSPSDTTDGNGSSNCSTESTPQVLYSIGNNQSLNVAYVSRKTTVTTPTTSTYVRSPDSSGIADSPTSSTHANISQTVTTDSSPTEMSSTSKPAKVGSKSKSRPKSTSNPPNTLKLNSSVPPKTSSQKPLEDEQTTQRILYILAEYKEQVENSPDKDKPAPRRRSNPPSNPGSSKRKKSSSSRRSGTRDMSPVHGEDTCRTMGSEDSSCGTSQGDCNESCLDSHSPQDSPRKVARKITFDQELNVTQPRPQPQRNVIVADGQTITVARGTTGKPATAVLMPANYILPVSMVKGGQQIAIVTNRGPKLLAVGGEGGATNALLLQRLIGPAGLKPVLARPGVRHVRLPTAALHNLQAFNLATATTIQPPDSTASPSGPTPPELVDTRATSSPWTDRDSHDVKAERGSSPEGSEPWNLPSSADPHEYTYEETVRTDNMDRTVLVVQKKDGSQRQHRLSHVSAAALRHKYAILEHELRLQKSLSEECEDLGVDSPSASELFPEAELLFAASPAHEHNQDPHHSHTPQPMQSSIPQPDMDDQIATDQLIPREIDVSQCLGDVGIVAVSEDGMQATIALDQEEFARSHPNTTFHSEPTEGEVQPFTITGLKGRHITSTIFHSNSAPATVLMTAPQATVISQAPDHSVKYEIENMINQMPTSHNNDINLSSVLVKDDGLTRFDSILTDSRELHLTNTASAIVHSSGNATQVIRRVCYEDDKRERDGRFLIDEPDNLIAGDDAKMVAEDSSRDATLESMADVDDDRSSPERHAELFWESNSASERSEGRRPLDFSSDSDKCCKSPFDETNSTDSSVGTHMRLDSVIKEARGRERSGSADGSSADDTHPPLRTYPPKRMYHPLEETERSLSGKTRAGERSPDSLEVRRRASGRGVVKRGCHCCNGSPAPPRPKKPRQRKPTLDFNTNN